MNEIREQAIRARRAFLKLSTYPGRTRILRDVAASLAQRAESIFQANAVDLSAARNTLAEPLYKRLVLNEPKLRDVIEGIEQIAAMPDPVGEVLDQTELDDGLLLRKVRTPIGVIAAIFESRPDVVPQIASLAIRSGNAVVLKGGSEATQTNAALADAIRLALEGHALGDAVQLISSREEVAELLRMTDLIGLVIPRGSNEMVRSIQESTRIPVLGHAEGICHVFIDETADPEKAVNIALDSKVQYPAACNSAETILIHANFPHRTRVLQALREHGVELRESEAAFGKEFSDLVAALRIVAGMEEAIDHIHRYGSGHTDTIVTEDRANADRFLNEVDSAGVYWNASTRFADGFRYGFGAEVGISTNKIHARGPVGVDGLLIYKYQLLGNGHVVATYTGEEARKFKHRRL